MIEKKYFISKLCSTILSKETILKLKKAKEAIFHQCHLKQ